MYRIKSIYICYSTKYILYKLDRRIYLEFQCHRAPITHVHVGVYFLNRLLSRKTNILYSNICQVNIQVPKPIQALFTLHLLEEIVPYSQVIVLRDTYNLYRTTNSYINVLEYVKFDQEQRRPIIIQKNFECLVRKEVTEYNRSYSVPRHIQPVKPVKIFKLIRIDMNTSYYY